MNYLKYSSIFLVIVIIFLIGLNFCRKDGFKGYKYKGYLYLEDTNSNNQSMKKINESFTNKAENDIYKKSFKCLKDKCKPEFDNCITNSTCNTEFNMSLKNDDNIDVTNKSKELKSLKNCFSEKCNKQVLNSEIESFENYKKLKNDNLVQSISELERKNINNINEFISSELDLNIGTSSIYSESEMMNVQSDLVSSELNLNSNLINSFNNNSPEFNFSENSNLQEENEYSQSENTYQIDNSDISIDINEELLKMFIDTIQNYNSDNISSNIKYDLTKRLSKKILDNLSNKMVMFKNKSTTLLQDVKAGDKKININQNIFEIGDKINISFGSNNEEINSVVGFSSLLLKYPLKYNHSGSTKIYVYNKLSKNELSGFIQEELLAFPNNIINNILLKYVKKNNNSDKLRNFINQKNIIQIKFFISESLKYEILNIRSRINMMLYPELEPNTIQEQQIVNDIVQEEIMSNNLVLDEKNETNKVNNNLIDPSNLLFDDKYNLYKISKINDNHLKELHKKLSQKFGDSYNEETSNNVISEEVVSEEIQNTKPEVKPTILVSKCNPIKYKIDFDNYGLLGYPTNYSIHKPTYGIIGSNFD